MSTLFSCNNQGRSATGKINLDGTVLSGTINSLDREGANRIAIGFPLTSGLQLEWSGRKIESKVMELGPGYFQIVDTGPTLEIEFVEEPVAATGTGHCPANAEDGVTRHLHTPFCP